jgi:flavin-dependent dehydrogenase
MSTEQVDVAISGGGPAGAAAALALARCGRRVLLVDRGHAGKPRIGEGLAPAARSLLAELGLMERFDNDAHSVSVGNVSAWGSPELQTTDFIRHPQGHGHQLDRQRFDATLRIAATEAGAIVLQDAQLHLVHARDAAPRSLHELECRDGLRTRRLKCNWLVDAGGRSSSLSRRLGAARSRLDRLVAFSMRLRSDRCTDQDTRTWVEAQEKGWWYSALLPNGERLVCFLTDADLADRRSWLHPQGAWSELLGTRHLSQLCRAHGYEPVGAPHGSDASSATLETFGGAGWIAAGDAALSFDPLSSQGIANAMYTGLRTARVLHAALNGNDALIAGHAEHLRAIYHAYLGHRRETYALEGRWPEAPFWRRRHEPHANLAPMHRPAQAGEASQDDLALRAAA